MRELNGEKIDVINKSDQPEVLISRALSPAKPLNLYIDDDAKHCVAVFDDEEMDSGVGRNYQNINLAAELTNYKIEAVCLMNAYNPKTFCEAWACFLK